DFGNAFIYTGGTNGVKAQKNVSFPTDGGSISIAAGGNIVGAHVTGGVMDWQPRAGRGGTGLQQVPTQWGTGLSAVSWNVGSLGGGDLAIRAGGNVLDLSAAIADSGIEQTTDVLTQFRGGVLSLDAGGDVTSVMLNMTRGDNRVRADGALNTRVDDASGFVIG